MRKFVGIVLAGSVITLFLGCEKKGDPVERGKYLVAIMDCDTCHTPKVPSPSGAPVLDAKRRLAGHPAELPYPAWVPDDMEKRHALALTTPMLTAWAGPWGVSFAANLTPDKETGIAEWSEQAFIRSMRTGKHQGQPNGPDILPPMPWEAYKNATEEDLKAIWAYLRSLPPIKNQVPFPVPPKAQK